MAFNITGGSGSESDPYILETPWDVTDADITSYITGQTFGGQVHFRVDSVGAAIGNWTVEIDSTPDNAYMALGAKDTGDDSFSYNLNHGGDKTISVSVETDEGFQFFVYVLTSTLPTQLLLSLVNPPGTSPPISPLNLAGGALTAASAAIGTAGAPALGDAADLVLTGGALTAASAAVGTAGAPSLTDPADLALTGGALTAASAAIGTTGGVSFKDPLALTGGALTAASAAIGTTGAPALGDVADLVLTGGALAAASAAINTAGAPTLAEVMDLVLSGGAISAASSALGAAGGIAFEDPPPEPLNALLSLEADVSDGLAHGYPDVIALSGDVTMEAWQPAESQIELRTLRAVSDVDGPSIHGRTRALAEETITVLLDDAAVAEQAEQMLNAVNRGQKAWLRFQIFSYGSTWRSPIRAGSVRLDSSTLQDGRGRRRYHLTVIREPWFELAGTPTSVLAATALRSRMPIAFTTLPAGTVAAPLILTLTASAAVSSGLRLHLYQDRAVPASWTPGYEIAASASSKPAGGHRRIEFAAEAPTGKNLGRDHDYQPVLAPASTTNAGVVRTQRGKDALTLGFGRSSMDISEETEAALLGYLRGQASIFTGLGDAGIGEDSDHYTVTAYADKISGTGWRLINAPADGYLQLQFDAGLTMGGQELEPGLYAAPSQRCVLLPLIETLGAAGAEYAGTALSIEAGIRTRVSEVI
ncbi:MAG: hypothetical protein OXG44_01345 [Gammaproteobacteria bacterium]|nr:hypothetical protein [Gammaproteobacteria bacterium]